MFDHVKNCVRFPIFAKQMSKQKLLSSYLLPTNNHCEECKHILEYDDQFEFYSESGAPYESCVNPVQQFASKITQSHQQSIHEVKVVNISLKSMFWV
jgi:hypothetical protein